MAKAIPRLAILAGAAFCLLANAPTAFAGSTYANTVLSTPSVVSFWRLGEQGAPTDTEGMTATDATGANPGVYHDAVDLGQPGSLEGDPSTAAEFGDPDGYVQMPDSAALNTPTFTIEGWVNFAAGTFNSDVYADGFDPTGYRIQTFEGSGTSYLAFLVGNGTNHNTALGLPVTPGRWIYFAGTYDGTTARFYENGVLVGQVNTGYVPNTTLPILVSGNPTHIFDGQIWGSIDDLAVYGTALSSGTIQQHYQLGIEDGAPPQTVLDSAPSGVTNQTAATIAFTSSSVEPTYQCQLDGGVWQTCSSPYQVSGLSDGPHRVAVRAVSRAGLIDPSPPSATWTVDTTPPTTSFISGPGTTTDSTGATFAFASEPGSTFACQLDGGVPQGCSSPYSVSGLVDGTHTLAILATDAAGNVEQAPATYSWSVDTASPTTFIIDAPTTNNPSQPFIFMANKGDVTFRCRIDAGPWQPCSSPLTTFPQTIGTHTFRVEATDVAGNVDPTDHAYIWTVTTSRPLMLSVKFPRQIHPLGARTARKSSANVPRYSWRVGQAATLELTVLNSEGRRVARATVALSRLNGSAAIPVSVLRRLTVPGHYTAVLEATSQGANSKIVRVAFIVKRAG